MMNIDEALDLMDELIDTSWAMPLSGGRCVIDVVRLRELMDDVRLSLPNEIKQAKAIVSDRAEIISEAKREAETIVARAEERARAMVAESEISRQAQARAQEIVSGAQQKSREIRQLTTEYVDEIVRSSEESLTVSLNKVKTVRQQMRSGSRGNNI